jgi:hypothetical protein
MFAHRFMSHTPDVRMVGVKDGVTTNCRTRFAVEFAGTEAIVYDTVVVYIVESRS